MAFESPSFDFNAHGLGLYNTPYLNQDEYEVSKRLRSLTINEDGFFYLKQQYSPDPNEPLNYLVQTINDLLPSDWTDITPENLTDNIVAGGRRTSGVNRRRVKGIDSNTIEYIYNKVPRNEIFVLFAYSIYNKLKSDNVSTRDKILYSKLILYIFYPFLRIIEDNRLASFTYELINTVFRILSPDEFEEAIVIRKLLLGDFEFKETITGIPYIISIIGNEIESIINQQFPDLKGKFQIIIRPKDLLHLLIKFKDRRNIFDVIACTIILDDNLYVPNMNQLLQYIFKDSGFTLKKVDDFYVKPKDYNSDYKAIHLDYIAQLNDQKFPLEIRICTKKDFEENRKTHDYLKVNVQGTKRISTIGSKIIELSSSAQNGNSKQSREKERLPLRTSKGFNCITIEAGKPLDETLDKFIQSINADAAKIAGGYRIERNEKIHTPEKGYHRARQTYNISSDGINYIVTNLEGKSLPNFELKPFDSLTLLQNGKDGLETFLTLDKILDEIYYVSNEDFPNLVEKIRTFYPLLSEIYLKNIRNRLKEIDELTLSSNKFDRKYAERLYAEIQYELREKGIRIEYINKIKNHDYKFIKENNKIFVSILNRLTYIEMNDLIEYIDEELLECIFEFKQFISKNQLTFDSNFRDIRFRLANRITDTKDFDFIKRFRNYLDSAISSYPDSKRLELLIIMRDMRRKFTIEKPGIFDKEG